MKECEIYMEPVGVIKTLLYRLVKGLLYPLVYPYYLFD
nr:MAG TPA: hypothetical protein [Caudoviricetes sp.]